MVEENVSGDTKRCNQIYCKGPKSDSITQFEIALKEEVAKLEHKMRVGYSTLRKLAQKLRSLRKVFISDCYAA